MKFYLTVGCIQDSIAYLVSQHEWHFATKASFTGLLLRIKAGAGNRFPAPAKLLWLIEKRNCQALTNQPAR